MYGGLSRPTALDSDSPFAIASHALHDKSTPLAPKTKFPQKRATPPTPVYRGQPVASSIIPGPPPPPSQQQPLRYRNQPPPHPQPQQQSYSLRDGARDAYMGAGAWNEQASRYGSPAPPHSAPPQHQGYYPSQPQGSASRAPANAYSNPYPVAPPESQVSQGRPPSQQPFPVTERPGSSQAQASHPPPSAPPQQQHAYHHQQQQQQHHQQPPPRQQSHSYYQPQPQQVPAGQSFQAPAYPQSSPYYTTSSPRTSTSTTTYQSPVLNHVQQQPPPQGINPSQLQRPAPRGDGRDSTTGQELWEMFSSMDLQRTGQLGNKELRELLARDSRWRITPREDCVKMLMSIFDSDRSGFISFVEFEGLWAYIKDWHKIFLRFDRDASGTIDRSELDQALQSFGYPLPRDLVRKLEKRFAPPRESDGSVPRGITFDRFLMACVTVKHFTEAFRKRDVRSEGKLTIDYNTFMELVIEAPV